MSQTHSEPGAVRDELRRACTELERRLRAGEGRAEDLLTECPPLAESPEAALELVYTEFVLRQELGQQPSPQEWYDRFPRWRDDLAQLFDVHRLACAGLTDTNLGDTFSTGAPAAPGLVGRRLGGYELLGELGRGGMGVVYKARQTALDRLVAVKLILTGDYSGPRERARFRTEAEAVARLDHPNIVQVHEVGEHDGRPFYSMEYVTGGHLAEKLQGAPWPCGEAVGLVRTLALAVEHAHQRGIVHRDLKPANILLTADGTPKITDFGLARRLPGEDRKTVLAEGRTQSGTILGSPLYMAPEQAAGERREITPAADVYALGSILYELLTGRPPFHGVNVLEILEQVRSSEPPRPRKLVPTLPRDLETICLKCLRKQPEKRYPSAQALAEDLRRFQAGEPVVARPVGRLERTVKWARRKPAVAAMLAVVAGLLSVKVAGVALAFQALSEEQVRTARQRDLAEENLALARKAEAEARENLDQARKAVDECFGVARDDPLLQAESMRKVRRLLLAKTLPFYKGFVERTPDDPALAARQAEYLFKVAYITQEIGSKAAALASFEQAGESFRKLSEAYPDVTEYRASLSRCWINLATMQSEMGRSAEARDGFERAVGILRRLAEDHPTVGEYRNCLATAWDNLGLVQNRSGNQAEALRSLDQARDLRRRLTAEHPGVARYQVALARTYKHLGDLLGRTDKSAEGLDSFEKALAIFRELDKTTPRAAQHRAEFASTLIVLSDLQLRTRRRPEAQQNARQAVAILSALHRAFPDVTRYQASLAEAWEHLAGSQPDPRDAVKSLEQAREIRRRLIEADPEVVPYRASLARNGAKLGAIQTQLKRHEDALKTSGEARDILEKLCAAYPDSVRYRWELAATCNTLGNALKALGRKREALESYRRAVVLLLGLTKKPSAVSREVRLGLVYSHIGLVLCDTGQPGESLEAFTKGLAVLQNAHGRVPSHPLVPGYLRDNHWGRARALSMLGRHREAAPDWGEAARLDNGAFRPKLLAWQALSLARAGEYAEAARLAEPLAEPADLPGAILFDLARVHALSARALGRDPARPLAEREHRAVGHAREAVALLGRAARAGFFRDGKRGQGVQKDPTFEAVHPRDDFRHWLAGLE